MSIQTHGALSYISTRGGAKRADFKTVLLEGMAPDGGLYVPEELPRIDMKALKNASYAQTALAVLGPFLESLIERADLEKILRDIYAPGRFDDAEIMPLRALPQVHERLYILEQFHGPTLAFKDAALQLVGRLFDVVLAGESQKLTIVGATSGDTGSAAIAGCKDCRNVSLFILHPHGRVSEAQRRQMTTCTAQHVHNIAIEGTFDDCQALVKALFADQEFARRHRLSAVNSINWARIAAQIVYYVHASLRFDTPPFFIVPTGNFGNVLAGHYARAMGAPMAGLMVASNRNDILTRFFESGKMQTQGVIPTSSPSMDIQVSSNFERYLFELWGRDSSRLRLAMQEFRSCGEFEVSAQDLQRARSDFLAARVSEDQTRETMAFVYRQTGIMIDPHTAVGVYAALARADEIQAPLVALATAHPSKFAQAVEQATGRSPAIPPSLAAVLNAPERLNVLPNSLGAVQDYIDQNAS